MTGIPARVMGNGEGFTTLILTDAESRLIRAALDGLVERSTLVGDPGDHPAAKAFRAGIQRATDRIKAEFEAEQKKRKDAKK